MHINTERNCVQPNEDTLSHVPITDGKSIHPRGRVRSPLTLVTPLLWVVGATIII